MLRWVPERYDRAAEATPARRASTAERRSGLLAPPTCPTSAEPRRSFRKKPQPTTHGLSADVVDHNSGQRNPHSSSRWGTAQLAGVCHRTRRSPRGQMFEAGHERARALVWSQIGADCTNQASLCQECLGRRSALRAGRRLSPEQLTSDSQPLMWRSRHPNGRIRRFSCCTLHHSP